MQKAEIDITEVVTDAEKGGGSGSGGDDDGDVVEPPTEIELPLDDQVEVEKPTTNPDGGGVVLVAKLVIGEKRRKCLCP